MNPADTSKDANVKLTVDGAAGVPVAYSSGGLLRTSMWVSASVTVANGQWHRVQCSRGDSLLTVAVDGVYSWTHGHSLVTVHSERRALCIGGKGTTANNDQLAGSIDALYAIK